MKASAPLFGLVCISACLLLTGPATAASLLVYYDGTLDGGNALVDQSGNNNHAAFDANGSATTPTVSSTGPAYTGSGSYVSLPGNGSNQSGRFAVTTSGGFAYDFNNQSWSMSMFYNRQSSTTVDTLFHIGAGDGYGTENELYAWATNGNTTLSLQHYPGPDVSINAAGKMNVNAWHHLAVTFTASGLNDGTGVLSFYVDGASAVTDDSFLMATNNTFYFGGQGSTLSADRNFLGFLDDMALFDGVLSAGDIAALSSGSETPLTIPEPGRALLLMVGALGLLTRRRRAAC